MRRVVAISVCALVLVTVLVGMAVTAGVVAPTAALAAPSATSTPLTAANPRDMVVEPTTGRVFVSGGDAIDVFAPDGTRTTTITGVPGAGGLDLAGGSLWATTSAKALVEVDLATFTVVRSVPTTYALRPGLAVVGTKAFARMDNPFFPGSDAVLGVDLMTGAIKAKPGGATVRFHRAANVTDRVFVVTEMGDNPSTVKVLSTTPPYPVLAEWTTAGLDASAVSPDGRVLWGASDEGATTEAIRELDLASGAETGIGHYEGLAPSIAYTPARGGLLAGVSSSRMWLNQVGVARSAGELSLPFESDYLVAFSPDGSVLWRATSDTLERRAFEPTITSISPASYAADRPSSVQLSGDLITGATGVSVGGMAVGFGRSGNADRILTDVVPPLPVGVHQVLVEHPLGEVSTTLTVTPAVSDVRGSVHVGGTIAPGVTVRLSGGALGTPLTTTTSFDGGFTFFRVPVANGYRLEVDPPSDARSGHVIERLSVVSRQTASYSIHLRSAAPAAEPSTTTRLPGSTTGIFGRFASGPVGGSTFVQKASDLLAIDRDGDLVGQVKGFGAPRGISAGGGSIFVGSTSTSGTGARVTRVDAGTLQVTGEWDVDSIGNGQLAHAGGRIFIGTDPGGDLRDARPVDRGGAPGRGDGSGDGARSGRGCSAPAARVDRDRCAAPRRGRIGARRRRRRRSLAAPAVAVAADGPSDRLWTAAGVEYELSSLTPTGRTFGVQGTPTASPAHGGIVAFGPSIVSSATASVAHTVGASPNSGLGSTGDAAFSPTSAGDLTVLDLTPHVTGPSGPPAFVDGTLTLSGWGLLSTTAAEIDGVSVPFVVRSATMVEVDVTSAAGPHHVRLTTPWGTTAAVPFETQTAARALDGDQRRSRDGHDPGWPRDDHRDRLRPGRAGSTSAASRSRTSRWSTTPPSSSWPRPTRSAPCRSGSTTCCTPACPAPRSPTSTQASRRRSRRWRRATASPRGGRRWRSPGPASEKPSSSPSTGYRPRRSRSSARPRSSRSVHRTPRVRWPCR